MSRSEHPTSNAQDRALRLLGLPAASDYSVAAETLTAAGFDRTGLPRGTTWRAAAKLDDAALLDRLRLDATARDEDAEVNDLYYY